MESDETIESDSSATTKLAEDKKSRVPAARLNEPKMQIASLGAPSILAREFANKTQNSTAPKNFKSPSARGRLYKSAVVAIMANKFKKFEATDGLEDDEQEEDDRRWGRLSDHPDYSSEHLGIENIINYLRQGDVTVTIIALCLLRRARLNDPVVQIAIKDSGGLEILLNLLDTDEVRCQQGALKVLYELSLNPFIRQQIVSFGGLTSMITLLSEPSLQLRCLLAKTIARLARCQRSVATVRRWGGIPYFIQLLDVPESFVNATILTEMQSLELEGARCGALALWSLSRSNKNKRLIWYCGAVTLLARLIKSTDQELLVPVVGTLQECASLKSFRLAIRVEGVLGYFRQHLNVKNDLLQMLCARAISKCAVDKVCREYIGKQGALNPLRELLADPAKQNNKELMAAVAGAIWKSALSIENVKRMKELDVVTYLVELLGTQPEDVLVNIVGAIGLCAKLPENSTAVRSGGGLDLLVRLLTSSTNDKLLVNVCRAVGICAADPENMLVIEELDAIRLLWSHLRSRNPEVQASAAWALCPCIRNIKDCGLVVRSFVGGMETLVGLLKSPPTKKLHAAVCAVVCEVARDEDSIGVMSDYGIVFHLSKLCHTADPTLQRYLAGAVGACCRWNDNSKLFGEKDVIPLLVGFLRSSNKKVQLTTAKALYELSLEPSNCAKMHRCGAVKYLTKLIASGNEEIQEASAYCLKNIRTLAMAAERLIYA